jgi:hypothetical protein
MLSFSVHFATSCTYLVERHPWDLCPWSCQSIGGSSCLTSGPSGFSIGYPLFLKFGPVWGTSVFTHALTCTAFSPHVEAVLSTLQNSCNRHDLSICIVRTSRYKELLHQPLPCASIHPLVCTRIFSPNRNFLCQIPTKFGINCRCEFPWAWGGACHASGYT